MKILSCVIINCLFMLSNTFSSGVYITPNCVSINRDAVLSCMDKNTWNFGTINLPSNCAPFSIPRKCNTFISIPKYIEGINSFLLSNELPVWYLNLLLCRSFFVIQKNYWSLFDKISYDSIPDNCKKLLSENIEELKSKCNVSCAQKLSVLTAIHTSWEDALSAMKEIVGEKALSHKYTLTEALFILHLKPSQSCFNNLINYFKKNNYKDKNVLFYAKCLTGALACVLKHDGRIPVDFKFDLIKDDNNDNEESYLIKDNNKELYLIKNVKKLMQAYKDNFIREQNRMKTK